MIGFDGGKKRRRKRRKKGTRLFFLLLGRRGSKKELDQKGKENLLSFLARAFEFFSSFFVGATQPKLIKDTEKPKCLKKVQMFRLLGVKKQTK